MNIPIRDKHMCGQNMTEFFDTTSAFIYQALKKKEGILVHCKKGHHRSAAAVAAFLIKYYGLQYEVATKYINKLRPCALRRDKCISNGLFNYNLKLKGITQCNVKCQKYDRSNEVGAMTGMNSYGCRCV